jgi:hypothetical protein
VSLPDQLRGREEGCSAVKREDRGWRNSLAFVPFFKEKQSAESFESLSYPLRIGMSPTAELVELHNI